MASKHIYPLLYQFIYILFCQFDIMSKIEEIAEYEDEVDELYHYVLRNNLEAVKQILKKYPGEANKIFQSQTLLDYPCRHGKIDMVKLLIECGVDVNNRNKIGSPPLLYAIAFNNFEIVKILCENKAKVEGIIVQESLTMIDLTVLHGRYDSGTYIYNLLTDKTLKTPEEYSAIAKKYYLRYVNYPMFIEGIEKSKTAEEVGDFLIKPIKADTDDDEDACCCSCFSFMFSKVEEKSSKGQNPESQTGTERKMVKQ